MKNKISIAKTAFVSMCVAFVIGLILVFVSPMIGEGKGRAESSGYDGGMDTDDYSRIVNTTIITYRTIGVVIAIVGGAGLLISGYVIYNEL